MILAMSCLGSFQNLQSTTPTSIMACDCCLSRVWSLVPIITQNNITSTLLTFIIIFCQIYYRRPWVNIINTKNTYLWVLFINILWKYKTNIDLLLKIIASLTYGTWHFLYWHQMFSLTILVFSIIVMQLPAMQLQFHEVAIYWSTSLTWWFRLDTMIQKSLNNIWIQWLKQRQESFSTASVVLLPVVSVWGYKTQLATHDSARAGMGTHTWRTASPAAQCWTLHDTHTHWPRVPCLSHSFIKLWSTHMNSLSLIIVHFHTFVTFN